MQDIFEENNLFAGISGKQCNTIQFYNEQFLDQRDIFHAKIVFGLLILLETVVA